MNNQPNILHVSKKPGVRYGSINEAIYEAPEGSTIIVEPGRYEEEIIINKKIQIIGNGSIDMVILEAKETVILIDTEEEVFIKGLTISQSKSGIGHAIEIPKGKPVIEDCHIYAGIADCINIANMADPVIRQCKLSNGKGKGIVFSNFAKGTIDSCELNGFYSPALWIMDGSHPVVKNCKIYDGKAMGVVFDNNGRGILTNCEIYQIHEKYPAIWVNDHSNPVISGSYIHSGKGNGILVEKESKAVIEDCQIERFEDKALVADEGSTLTIHHSKKNDEIGTESCNNKISQNVFAIDLGVSNTRVCFLIKNEFSPVITFPSFLSYIDGDWEIGSLAKNAASSNTQTFSGLIQGIGKNKAYIIDEKNYTGEELLGRYLNCINDLLEESLGERMEKCVITSSNLDDYIFTKALKDTLKRFSGLEVLRVIGQAKALGLAYGKEIKKEDETILFVNIGGGSLDIAVMNIGEGVHEVVTHSDDFELGGEHFDLVIVHHLLKEFNEKYQLDLSKDPMAVRRLKHAAENGKIELASISSTNILLPDIYVNGEHSYRIESTLTIDKFEQLISHLVDKIKLKIENVLFDSKIVPDDIDRIVLSGGSSQIPMISTIFGSEKPVEILDADLAVKGTALQAGLLTGDLKDMVFLDATGHSIGIQTASQSIMELVKPYTTIPASHSNVFTTTRDHQTEMDFHILLGNQTQISKNKTLVFFQIKDLPKAPKGELQIELTIEIDKNHLFRIKVQDLVSGQILKSLTLTKEAARNDIHFKNEIALKKGTFVNIREENQVVEKEVSIDEIQDLVEELISIIGVEKVKQSLREQINLVKH
ncbi:Hsp70 family protein [Bacillus sp. 1P10SD]|uniref:Hsp70 family protein n=1 Tax=Bacillus sp. 1P10SD TaxID=3132265 RepID=UPI0039A5BBD8